MNQQNIVEVTDMMLSFLEKVIQHALKIEGADDRAEVSIVLTDDEHIRNLNKKHRGIDNPTDVLSFPMIDNFNEEMPYEGEIPLGDIVISLERVEEQRKDYGHSFERELAYLAVHGLLHLLGYDHINDDDQREMRAREEEILSGLKITR
ncbi:Endoribonuclease YbeY [Koleobacter methoxysyntrophicus]|jgi:probable rRNA maturation factor|uniref:Endoribonuclease YbeY n=2 Tax=Koleobacter methoxysyntrophicus TaxID=2751313 RepID=A0A8A0RP83_9FIRM|nr:Endoribonuclease YbeY [Koleobacter methoxysyntrophicus]